MDVQLAPIMDYSIAVSARMLLLRCITNISGRILVG